PGRLAHRAAALVLPGPDRLALCAPGAADRDGPELRRAAVRRNCWPGHARPGRGHDFHRLVDHAPHRRHRRMTTDLVPRLFIALISAIGVVLLGMAVQRMMLRRRIRARVRALGVEEPSAPPPLPDSGPSMEPRALASRLGQRIALHLPSEAGVMAA